MKCDHELQHEHGSQQERKRQAEGKFAGHTKKNTKQEETSTNPQKRGKEKR